MLTVDSKSIFSPKPSNINTPTKSQALGDCCDLLTQENVSDALERKSNNVEQPVSLELFTTLFNGLFEETISLRSYVNEQFEKVKKSQYDSKQSAKCNHSTRTDELQHQREGNRSKAEIIKLLSEKNSLGNNKVKDVLPHKENTFTESSRKHSFKANEKFGNQKSSNYLLFRNHFETLDIESHFTAHESPNRRENLNISDPSNNANNSANNNFSNKLNSTRRRPQVAINQNPKNDNDH